jgi:hypothetical protein
MSYGRYMSISYDEVTSIDGQTLASVHVCVLCRIGVGFLWKSPLLHFRKQLK